jgi:hypothetical protein
MDDEFKLFPWENGVKPDFVNDGFEWYIDKISTEYARQDTITHKGLRNVACFTVRKDDVITRIMIDNKQHILFETPSLVAMGEKIDILKVLQHYKN